LRGFFASLFGGGGGGEDEEEARQSAPVVMAGRVAGRGASTRQQIDGGEDEGGEVARLEPQRRLMAKAETNLPRGEIYMGAPPALTPSPNQVPPLPQTQPASAATLAPPRPAPADSAPDRIKPEPVRAEPAQSEADEAGQAKSELEKPHPLDDAPQPPRRPSALESAVADAPLPPPRPVGLAALPAVITHGGSGEKLALRPAQDAIGPLAYATASQPLRQKDVSQDLSQAVPLPPPRPPTQALRRAASANAEQRRADHAAAEQMAPARVDRAAITTLLAPAGQTQAHGAGAAAAPALRAAAKSNLLAAAPVAGSATRFGVKAGAPNANAFSKEAD
jgi:hypothetical protein